VKLLNKVNEKVASKSTPYTPEEIDLHENAGRIWATIAQKCKREAQEEGRQDLGRRLLGKVSPRQPKRLD
jgi:hypothetical protein